MEKRGQAAMEFLMTYGWAILAAIIAIGVLAYFGVFNPGKLAGSQGLVASPFNMDAFKISGANDEITMEITQNLGESINLLVGTGGFDVDLESPGAGQCTVSPSIPTDVVTIDVDANGVADNAWESGKRITFTVDCTAGSNWNEGDQVRAKVMIKYRKSGSAIDLSSSGSARGVSQA